MEDKLPSSSDIGLLFANVLNNILSDNCNLLKNLVFAIASDGMALGRIWSIARLTFNQTRCGADHFINICAALTNCAIFGQSRSALAIGLGLRLRLGVGLGLGA